MSSTQREQIVGFLNTTGVQNPRSATHFGGPEPGGSNPSGVGVEQGQSERDWGLRGFGQYGSMSAAMGPGMVGEARQFRMFSEPGVSYEYKDFGSAIGLDAGAAVGMFAIFGHANNQLKSNKTLRKSEVKNKKNTFKNNH